MQATRQLQRKRAKAKTLAGVGDGMEVAGIRLQPRRTQSRATIMPQQVDCQAKGARLPIVVC